MTVLALRVHDRVVARLVEAERALKRATTIQQAKVIADVAAAQQVFARRQQLGEDIIGYAHAIKVYALARLGELLWDMEKAGGPGVAGPGRGKTGTRAVLVSGRSTLADLGLTKKVASVAQQLARLEPDVRDAIAKRERTMQEVRRTQKADALQVRIELPTAKYRVLYADPPWPYADKCDDGAVQAGGAGRHYPPMSIKDLCALPVKDWAEPDAVLFLWVTCPLLLQNPGPREVIEAWGFAYKENFVWDKVKHNLGHYHSVRHELLLICGRGQCTPVKPTLFDSVQSIERTGHSEKPERFREIIDTLYSKGKRLEMFAREKKHEGWDMWGNEAPAV